MTQEATMIIVDNTSYMRNGDFTPDRFVAQREALMFVCHSKKRLNVENSIGLSTMAGQSRVLCALSSDPNKVVSRMSGLQPEGESNGLGTALAVAHLVLRNRMSRGQKPRIVAFVGSPVPDSAEELIKIAKRLKKEKVGVTFINFGETDQNEKPLADFLDVLNGRDGEEAAGHMLVIRSGDTRSTNGVSSLVEYLRTCPAIVGPANTGTLDGLGAGGAPGQGMDGMDDVDLAYALRISIEEQMVRQGVPVSTPPQVTPALLESRTAEEALLGQAVAATHKQQQQQRGGGGRDELNLYAMTEEEQVAYAISMSMDGQQQGLRKRPSQENESTESKKEPDDNEEASPTKIVKKDSEIK